MDPLASAFAVYKAKKISNKQKKKKKPQIAPTSPKITFENIPDNLKKDAAKKIKKEEKKMTETKNIIKKKTHKKKKVKKVASLSRKIKSATKPASVILNNDEIPILVPAPIPVEIKIESDAQSSQGSFDFDPVLTDSAEEGLKVFKWMIAPYNSNEFINRVWEKKPLHIARNKSDYYKEIITTPIIDDMLRNENIQFTKNLDVTSYIDGKRDTYNPEGRAYPHTVWDFYLNGCSIRLSNPQTFIPKLHIMNATLQEFFNSFVGANAYLTPPDSQGFAPHYDDIEGFMLQTEGKKHWRIYKPLNDKEVLPRASSKNYDQNEIGEPIMEVTLQAGDMLYLPRGYIHQGITIEGEHSLHVTVSMYQMHSWADLFEKMIPAALQIAIDENVELRQGLPFDLYDNFGFVNSDLNTPRRLEIENIIKSLFDKIKTHLPIDDAVDQMHKHYQEDVLPPVLSDLEKAVTVFGDSDVMGENGIVKHRVELNLDTRLRLLRKNILRMVSENTIRLYYYLENSLEYHGKELPYLEIDPEYAPTIEMLIRTYPEYVSVENFDLTNDLDKMHIAEALWSRGLVMTEYPLASIDD